MLKRIFQSKLKKKSKPSFVEVYADIESRKISYLDIKKKYSLTDEDWNRLSSKVYAEYRKRNPKNKWNPKIIQNINVNTKLKKIALGFPRYGTRPELDKVEQALNSICPDYNSINKYLRGVIMNPELRAMQLENCFLEPTIYHVDNIFYPFAYIIDSALLAYYRGNYVTALISY